MVNIIDRIVRLFVEHPQRLFLVDGLGAVLTTLSLMTILFSMNQYFGMPEELLLYLSVIAALYCTYSISCYLFVKEQWRPFIRTIYTGNSFYCLLLAGLIVKFSHELTALGIFYFVVECLLISTLAFLEWKTFKNLKMQKVSKLS